MFGYVRVEPLDPKCCFNTTTSLLSVCSLLNLLVKKFWRTEKISNVPIVNTYDGYVEHRFQNTHTWNKLGRHSFTLPIPILGLKVYQVQFMKLQANF